MPFLERKVIDSANWTMEQYELYAKNIHDVFTVDSDIAEINETNLEDEVEIWCSTDYLSEIVCAIRFLKYYESRDLDYRNYLDDEDLYFFNMILNELTTKHHLYKDYFYQSDINEESEFVHFKTDYECPNEDDDE